MIPFFPEAFSDGDCHDGSPDGRSEPAVLPFQPRRTGSSGSSPTPAQSNRHAGAGRSSREAGAVLQRHRLDNDSYAPEKLRDLRILALRKITGKVDPAFATLTINVPPSRLTATLDDGHALRASSIACRVSQDGR